ncbi:MAG: ABC transporter permease [Nannocystis sp.]|nr:ABC transporter permease [Nannocystis sp.]
MSPSLRLLLGRLAAALVTLLLVVVIVFAVANFFADPVALALGPGASPAEAARLRAAWGLDQPALHRLARLLAGLLRGELGLSASGHPVSQLLARALLPTLAYALPGAALATVLGLTGGLFAARRRGHLLDRLTLAAATLLLSLSGVIVVIFARDLLAFRADLFPLVGWPLAGSADPIAPYLALPALTWALLQLGPDLRHYRALFCRELRAPYLDGLRARGLPESTVLRRALRVAAAPILARLVARVPHLFVGGVVLEHVFNVPGLGGLAIAALRGGDLHLLEGIALTVAAATIAAQFLIGDLLAPALDPRLRARGPA